MDGHMKLGALALGTGLALAGCGDDGGGGGGIAAGVDGDTTLADLSDEDAVRICMNISDALERRVDIVELNCTSAGIFAAALGDGTVATCEAEAAACVDDPPPEAEEETFDCDPSEVNDTDCDVTVDEAAACLEDQLDALADFAALLTCDLLESAEEPDVDEPETPASCVPLEERCPDIFGDEE